jgi:Lrp/AsnC family leucine-responsive transcriptional regulator
MPVKRRQSTPSAFGTPHPELDETNLRLLAELIADARLPMSALARRVGMSAPAVTERVRRMREAGILTGYTAGIDPAALGLPVAAYVRIRPGPGQLPRLMDHAAGHEQVSECHRITGEDCLLVKVHAPTIEQLESVLDSFLLYGQTTTSIVVSSPVPPRQLPLPGNAGARA